MERLMEITLKIRAQRKRYREIHPEKIREQKKRYWEANREKINKYQRKMYERHPGRIRETMKRYREKHHEKIQETMKRYWEVNREKIQEYRRRVVGGIKAETERKLKSLGSKRLTVELTGLFKVVTSLSGTFFGNAATPFDVF